MGKTPSSNIIHSLGGEYCSIVRDSEPINRFISQNEWTSLIIHDRRGGKFECMSALNKLQIREEWAFFGLPALIKLLVATSLAPRCQNHGRNIKKK